MSDCGGRSAKLLSAQEARQTLASRLASTANRLRARYTTFGLRPYVVELVWSRWTGGERGEGNERVLLRLPLLPIPKVEDLASINKVLFSAGTLPVGTVRISQLNPLLTADAMLGKTMPCDCQELRDAVMAGRAARNLNLEAVKFEETPEPYEFFWEIHEDGRTLPITGPHSQPVRHRFRPLSEPFLQADRFQWNILLERVSEDYGRDGKPKPFPIDDDLARG